MILKNKLTIFVGGLTFQNHLIDALREMKSLNQVTEVLDSFGRLVFERIKQKGLTASGKKKVSHPAGDPGAN